MKKNLKTILICVACLVAILCVVKFGINTHLGKFASNDISIDISEPIDINTYLTKVKEGTEIDYQLDEENSKLIVNLSKGNKSETLETDVNIIYPRVNIQENISIDTFTGYDIKDIVDAESDVLVSSSLNEDTSELTITYTKGEYTNTVVKTVKLFSSNPRDNVRYYDCANIRGAKYQMAVYPDGTIEEYELASGYVYEGYYEMKNNNDGQMYDMNNWPRGWRMGVYFSDDDQDASFFIGNDRAGGRAKQDVCTLTGTTDPAEAVKLIDAIEIH